METDPEPLTFRVSDQREIERLKAVIACGESVVSDLRSVAIRAIDDRDALRQRCEEAEAVRARWEAAHKEQEEMLLACIGEKYGFQRRCEMLERALKDAFDEGWITASYRYAEGLDGNAIEKDWESSRARQALAQPAQPSGEEALCQCGHPRAFHRLAPVTRKRECMGSVDCQCEAFTRVAAPPFDSQLEQIREQAREEKW